MSRNLGLKKPKKDQFTRAWRLYEEGRSYNNSLTPNYYSLVDTNTEFYAGNQWVHLPQTPAMRRLPKPTFNFIKRITNILVSQITSGGVSINLEPLSYYGSGEGEDVSPTEFAQAELNNLLEKMKINYRVRDAMFDGAQTGDYCAHFWWDPDAMPYGGASGPYRGEIKMELVDGVNVMFGNPNVADAQCQPYILLLGRATVAEMREEYLAQHPGDEVGAAQIQADAEWSEQIATGGKIELHGDCSNMKCMYAYLYEKVTTEEDMLDEAGNPIYEDYIYKNGEAAYEKGEDGRVLTDAYGAPVPKRKKVKAKVTRVHVSKYTRTQTIFEDVDTGLENYPIAWGNWEKQKNCYHGRALVTGVIPNQIFINTTFAMVMRHLQLVAFPKTIYNADLIGQWSNEVGQAIGVHGLTPGLAINQVAANMNPADMSNQITNAIDQIVTYTRETLGVTDAQMGNIKSENTSAIMVMQANAEVPLENIRSGLYEWMEDIAKILLDMMGTYYGERPIVKNRTFQEPVMDPSSSQAVLNQNTGLMEMVSQNRRVLESFDFSKLKHLWFGVSVDVGSSTAYSEVAMTQTLDNLRLAGLIDMVDYLERIPDKLVPRKQELIDKMKAQQATVSGVPAGSAIPDAQMDALTEPIQKQINTNKPGGANVDLSGKLSESAMRSTLPSNVQAQYDSLPTRAKNQLNKAMAAKTSQR